MVGVVRASRGRRVAIGLTVALLSLIACSGGPADRIAQARSLQDQQQFKESIPLLRQALTDVPDDGEANYLLGIALLRTGELSAAVWPLRRAAHSDARGVEAGVALSQTLSVTENYEEAETVASAVLEREPGNAEALGARAHARLQQSHFEEALADIDQLREQRPEDTKLLLVRADALQSAKRFEDARADLDQVEAREKEGGDLKIAAVACVKRAANLEKQDDGDHKRSGAEIERCLAAYPSELVVLQAATQSFATAGQNERAVAAWRKAVEEAPEAIELRLGLAEQLLNAGHKDDALEEGRHAAEDFGTVQAWLAFCQLQRRANDLAGADDSLQHAAELSTDPDPIRFERADLAVERGDLDGAEALVAELKEPSYAAIARGRIQLRRGDPAAALASFEQGLTRWPDNPGARAEAGRAAQELGQLDRALAHYRESARANAGLTNAALAGARIALALGRYEEARALVGAHIASHPFEGPDPYLVAVRAAEGEGKEGVVANLLTALDALGAKGAALAERARLATLNKGPAAAESLIEKSKLDLADPANEAALRALLDAQISQGHAERALASVDRVLAKDPDRASVRELRGQVLLALGRQKEATAAFEAALAAQDGYGPALTGLGSVAFAAGDLAGALEKFDAAEQAATPDQDAAYRAAQVLQAQGKTDEAEKRLRALLIERPDHAAANNDLAWLLAERNTDLDTALALAQRAVSALPGPDTFDTLAWVELRRGDSKAALATLDRALAANPDNPTLLFRLGLARKAAGDRAGALDALHKALGGDTFPQAEAARAEIAALEGEGRL